MGTKGELTAIVSHSEPVIQADESKSGIAVDPKDPFHAYVSFSGYNAYTPNIPGHVVDVHYNATTHQATWKDISSDRFWR